MALVLVTGANGFIGGAVCRRLTAKGHHVRAVARHAPSQPTVDANVSWHGCGDIDGETDWHGLLEGVEWVVHTAARVHVRRDPSPDPLAAYRRVNGAGSANLAQQAAAAGVGRLVFISSVAASRAAETQPGAGPVSPYGLSKWEAEQALKAIADQSGLELVVLRPPLVYGPAAPGRFALLLRMVRGGWPLPVSGLSARRSVIFIDNLLDAIELALEHPAAAGRCFGLCDDTAPTTAEWVQALARALDRPARLLPAPPTLLRLAGHLLGRRSDVEALMSDRRIDDREIRACLGWQPRVPFDQAVAASLASGAT